jgi:hypothetical protein
MGIHRRACITNAKFIYQKEGDHLEGKLKYFQHRDDRDTHIRQHDEDGNPIRRWVDRGLGDNYATIARNCNRLATQDLKNNVGARTLVISPQVDYMQALPSDRREAVMAELTETAVENWFEAMNLPAAEYAFVVHRGNVQTERPDEVEQAPEEFVHSHVVLAATVPGLTQDRDDYKVYKEQLEKLHRAGANEMERIWTRELGADRVQELNQNLDELTERLQAIDAEREQEALEAAMPDPYERDEALLEIYQSAGIDPPSDLLERVYDARDRLDPVEELRGLGFDIPQDEDVDVLQDLRDIGFDIPHDDELDPVQELRDLGFDIPHDEDVDVLQDLRDMGFDIPHDDPSDNWTDVQRDVVEVASELGLNVSDLDMEPVDDQGAQVYRDAGLFSSRDDLTPEEQMEEAVEVLRELGFDIPDEHIDVPDEPTTDVEPERTDIPDMDL